MSEMRLQRFLARAGVASRRECETYISEGRVTVNGEIADRLGTKVDPAADAVCVDGERVSIPREDVLVMLNKPLDVLTTMDDPQGRRCVASLVPADEYPGLYPVGRLDRNTTGLLLFATDGALGNQLLHPSHHVLKQYLVRVKGTPTRHETHLLRTGVRIETGKNKRAVTQPAEVELLEAGETALLRIGIREGINRQIRKMCAAVGHEVVDLHRTDFGPISLGDLPSGQWRLLTADEAASLRAAAGM